MKNKLLVFFSLGIIALSACNEQEQTHHTTEARHKRKVAPHNKPTVVNHDTLTIAAVGDIMLGSAYPNPKNLPPDNAKNAFNAAMNDLAQADVVFGNLEGTLVNTGTPEGKKKLKPYSFRMPVAYGAILKDAGFNVLSVANNHISDFGANGRKSTTQTLDSLGINYAGLQVKPTTVFTINGVKYGFCAFAPNSYVVPLNDLKNAARIIGDLKQQVDIVIVSFHGGGEGVAFEHVPCKKETFIGENRGDVHLFAHTAIDAGADLVLGNGPHISRAMELYNNRLIAYSLGNFCTYTSVSVAGVCGLAPLLKIHLNKKGEFLNGQISAYKQTHLNGLAHDTANKVIDRIRYLTEVDFPQSGLNIAGDGVVTPRP